MTRPLILLGDKTSHGGTVISASASSDCNGRGIARVGDKVSCPRKGHGRVSVIVSGDPGALIDGRPAARHGDRTACGAMLIASQALTTD
ncbi:MAG: PAAR domain-containing protein [Rhodocyclaceae bacterium]|nr:PAAR domain-containing protein [Rhodocyclaceae bacterium]MCP5232502.1 PAAR domain-containing protein [Zoogloeaceae bacterium]MCB1910284.1 PAAR domain-containing protein [Rhodocyclaceae bacterium]MCP5238599.1 PAAR domain-containing protein [Zoogloeaceae bacterium]MCP5254486.1 PAAR domain-containing protein [Zoogloeaceae bacterium]